MAKQKKISRVDLFKARIDQIFIRSGLEPSVWEYKNGYICYLPKKDNNSPLPSSCALLNPNAVFCFKMHNSERIGKKNLHI